MLATLPLLQQHQSNRTQGNGHLQQCTIRAAYMCSCTCLNKEEEEEYLCRNSHHLNSTLSHTHTCGWTLFDGCCLYQQTLQRQPHCTKQRADALNIHT